MRQLDSSEIKEFIEALDRAVSELSPIQVVIFSLHAKMQWMPQHIAEHLSLVWMSETDIKRELGDIFTHIRDSLVDRFGKDGFREYMEHWDELLNYVREYLA